MSQIGGAPFCVPGQLFKIQWEANGELSAQATCLAAKVAPWRVKLIKSGGVWDWQPRRTCPDA